MKTIFAMGIIATLASTQPSFSEESESVPVKSGDWALLVHRSSEVAAPDICVAFNQADNFGLRAALSGVSVRVSDDNWTLPPNVRGTIAIEVAGFRYQFAVDGNTENQADGTVPADQANSLINDMSSSQVMKVSAGSSSWVVSLTDSAKVLNAFRNCAGVPGGSKPSGSNPFD